MRDNRKTSLSDKLLICLIKWESKEKKEANGLLNKSEGLFDILYMTASTSSINRTGGSELTR